MVRRVSRDHIIIVSNCIDLPDSILIFRTIESHHFDADSHTIIIGIIIQTCAMLAYI